MIYFYCQDGLTVHGPADRNDIEKLLTTGRLGADTTFCAEGSSDWQPVSDVFPDISLPDPSDAKALAAAQASAAPRGPFFYCLDGVHVEGPFKPDDLVPLLRAGTLPAETLVCTAQDEVWRPVSSVFSYLLQTVTPHTMEQVRNLIASGPTARMARLDSGGYAGGLSRLQAAEPARPGFREVRCTACANEALLPDHLETAFCMFCGVKIDAATASPGRARLMPRASAGLLGDGSGRPASGTPGEELRPDTVAARADSIRLPGPPTAGSVSDEVLAAAALAAAPGVRVEGRNIQLTLPTWEEFIRGSSTGNPVFSKTAQVLYLAAAFAVVTKGSMLMLPQISEPGIAEAPKTYDFKQKIEVEVRPDAAPDTETAATSGPGTPAMGVVELGGNSSSETKDTPARGAQATTPAATAPSPAAETATTVATAPPAATSGTGTDSAPAASASGTPATASPAATASASTAPVSPATAPTPPGTGATTTTTASAPAPLPAAAAALPGATSSPATAGAPQTPSMAGSAPPTPAQPAPATPIAATATNAHAHPEAPAALPAQPVTPVATDSQPGTGAQPAMPVQPFTPPAASPAPTPAAPIAPGDPVATPAGPAAPVAGPLPTAPAPATVQEHQPIAIAHGNSTPAPAPAAPAATAPTASASSATSTAAAKTTPSDPLNQVLHGVMTDLFNGGSTGNASPEPETAPPPATASTPAAAHASPAPATTPQLARMNPTPGVNPNTLLKPEGVPLPKTEAERIAYGARALKIDLEKAAYVPTEDAIEDPTGSLNHFLDNLTRTQQGKPGAVTRVLHYGDSIVVMDFITGQMRERMHNLFGDSGAGYMLLDRPSASYQRMDLNWKSGGGWTIESIMKVKPKPGDYSLGGFAFDGAPGAFAEYTVPKKKEGDPYSLVEVHYLARPTGGKFDVLINGKKEGTIDTRADEVQARVARLRLNDGAETARINVTSGAPRLLGVVLERTRPGVVYDAAGVLGARCLRLKEIRPELLVAQLKERHPDLIVLNFGANESDDDNRSMAAIEADYSRLLALFRQALPKASILVMGALDRGERRNGKVVTKPNMPTIIMAQRAAALKNGCAFFNTFVAMGGDGTMGRWHSMRPRLVSGDFIHPTESGAAVVGDSLYRAVMKSFLLRVADRVLNPGVPIPGAPPANTPAPLTPPRTPGNATASGPAAPASTPTTTPAPAPAAVPATFATPATAPATTSAANTPATAPAPVSGPQGDGNGGAAPDNVPVSAPMPDLASIPTAPIAAAPPTAPRAERVERPEKDKDKDKDKLNNKRDRTERADRDRNDAPRPSSSPQPQQQEARRPAPAVGNGMATANRTGGSSSPATTSAPPLHTTAAAPPRASRPARAERTEQATPQRRPSSPGSTISATRESMYE